MPVAKLRLEHLDGVYVELLREGAGTAAPCHRRRSSGSTAWRAGHCRWACGGADSDVPMVLKIVGGLSLALARTFTIVERKLKNPSSEHWERAFRIFDLLL